MNQIIKKYVKMTIIVIIYVLYNFIMGNIAMNIVSFKITNLIIKKIIDTKTAMNLLSLINLISSFFSYSMFYFLFLIFKKENNDKDLFKTNFENKYKFDIKNLINYFAFYIYITFSIYLYLVLKLLIITKNIDVEGAKFYINKTIDFIDLYKRGGVLTVGFRFISIYFFQPIIEEYFLRYKFFKIFSETKPGKLVLFNSIIFGFIHLYTINDVINAFFISYFILALEYAKNYNLKANILYHFLLNIFNIIFCLIAEKYFFNKLFNQNNFKIILIICLVNLIILIVLIIYREIKIRKINYGII